MLRVSRGVGNMWPGPLLVQGVEVRSAALRCASRVSSSRRSTAASGIVPIGSS